MTNNSFKKTKNNRRHHYCQILGVGDKATKRKIYEAFWGLRDKFQPLKIREREGREPTQEEARKWKQIVEAWDELVSKEQSKISYEEITKSSEKREKGVKEISEALVKNWRGVKGYVKLNEETKQLFREKFREAFQVSPELFKERLRVIPYSSLSFKCWCNFDKFGIDRINDPGRFSCDWFGSKWFNSHCHNCLRIHQEVEEFAQRIIKIIEEINEEVCRAGIIVEEIFEERKAQEGQKNEKKGVDDKQQQLAPNSNQKQDEKENAKQPLINTDKGESQPEEKETNNNSSVSSPKSESSENNNPSNQRADIDTNKDVLIVKLKLEIAELKKNLDPNNAKQKALLAQKEAQLVELESKDKQNQGQVSGNKNNKKENNLISALLPIGIIFAVLLVFSSAIWIAKKRKGLKRIKIKK